MEVRDHFACGVSAIRITSRKKSEHLSLAASLSSTRLVDPTSAQTSTNFCGDKYIGFDGSLHPGLWSIPMMSLFLIASAILLPIVASANYYCDSGITMCCTNTTTVCVMITNSKKALKHAKF
jgi:hypothetical protein